jgi:hypothetical protein
MTLPLMSAAVTLKSRSVHRPHASSSFDKLQSWLRHDDYCQVEGGERIVFWH